jgi:hypothetical protein
MIALFLCLLYHLMEAQVGVPKDSQVIPVIYTKGQEKKRWKVVSSLLWGHKGQL